MVTLNDHERRKSRICVILPNSVDLGAITQAYCTLLASWSNGQEDVGSGGGKGKGVSAPGGTVQDAAFGGAKIWNSGIWPLLANWRLHCRTYSAGKFNCIM